MDNLSVGRLIKELRTEKGLTQKNLADMLSVSDRAVSKWERGLGCPDISLLGELSKIFGVSTERLLLGVLGKNPIDSGNVLKTKFYVCPTCGNILFSFGDADMYCCGRILAPLTAKKADEAHAASFEDCDGDVYVALSHEMSRAHHIKFAVCFSFDRFILIRLYPEQDCSFTVPKQYARSIFVYCTEHGFMKIK